MPRLAPAFDDRAIAAACQRARALWRAESQKERDRLLTLAVPKRLVALDDDVVRHLLTPEHRADLRASIAATRTAQPSEKLASCSSGNQSYEAELAAWRRRDAAALAQAARLRRRAKLERALMWSGAVVLSVVLLILAARHALADATTLATSG